MVTLFEINLFTRDVLPCGFYCSLLVAD